MTPNNDFLDNLSNEQHQKMLREIANDDLTPKKHNFKVQKEIHEKIRMMTMMTGNMALNLQY